MTYTSRYSQQSMDAADHTGAVVSASDWGRKVVSSCGIFHTDWLLPRAGGVMGPVGRMGHSRASFTSRMRLSGCGQIS